MTYLLTHFWAWGVSAFAVGLATALSVARRSERGPVSGWLVWFALAFAAGLPVAALELLPGRSGFWLETGLLLFPSFLAGAALGALIGGHSLRDNEGWAIGLIPLALMWLGADFLAGRSVEQDLKRKAASVIEKVGGDPAYLDVAGRDILLPRDAAKRAAAEAEIAHIPGVRRIADVDGLAGSAAKSFENAVTARRAAREDEASAPPASGVAPNGAEGPAQTPQNGQPPAANGGPGAASPAAPSGSAPKSKDQMRSGAKPAPTTPVAVAPELARPSGAASASSEPAPPAAPAASGPDQSEAERPIPASGELDVPTCQKALTAALAREPVRFSRRGAGVRRASTGALDKAIGLLQRCPQSEVEVRVRAEGGDRAARTLARDRAARVVDYLGHMGVERGRLSVAGESGRPVSKDAPESASGSGVDFQLSPRR
ncbi:hypothetical protein IY145_04565 [Methylosinus sp. H3A]|uniref:hypothetical protein n=1 Tax=Methylosinus sp. H3A TaxID=2785786 RepID=UPI0018C2835F|nr:hypothetical protein [Methylosinus sp. H3A]MBG0808643.1 hypothetical protein [Methylosinus sp. H3A]